MGISPAPISFKGRLVQYAGRILRRFPGKATAEIHDYHDTATGVLAASLAKRAARYISSDSPIPAASLRACLRTGQRPPGPVWAGSSGR